MHTDYLSPKFTQTSIHRGDEETSTLRLSMRDRLVWSFFGAASATPIIFSHDLRMFLATLVKVAWLYMVAGARG